MISQGATMRDGRSQWVGGALLVAWGFALCTTPTAVAAPHNDDLIGARIAPDGRHVLLLRRAQSDYELWSVDPPTRLSTHRGGSRATALFTSSETAVVVSPHWDAVHGEVIDLMSGATRESVFARPGAGLVHAIGITPDVEPIFHKDGVLSFGDDRDVRLRRGCRSLDVIVDPHAERVHAACQKPERLSIASWTTTGELTTRWANHDLPEDPYVGAPKAVSSDGRYWTFLRLVLDRLAGTHVALDKTLYEAAAAGELAWMNDPVERDLRLTAQHAALTIDPARGVGVRALPDHPDIAEVFQLETQARLALLAPPDRAAALAAHEAEDALVLHLEERTVAMLPALVQWAEATAADLEARGYTVLHAEAKRGWSRYEMTFSPYVDCVFLGASLPEVPDTELKTWRTMFDETRHNRKPSEQELIVHPRDGLDVREWAYRNEGEHRWFRGKVVLDLGYAPYGNTPSGLVVACRDSDRPRATEDPWRPVYVASSSAGSSTPAAPSWDEQVRTLATAIRDQWIDDDYSVTHSKYHEHWLAPGDGWVHVPLVLENGFEYLAVVVIPEPSGASIRTNWSTQRSEILYPNREPAPFGMNRLSVEGAARGPAGRETYYFNYAIEPPAMMPVWELVFKRKVGR